MIVFAIFVYTYMKQELKPDFLWAGLCLVGAAYFMFRGGRGGEVNVRRPLLAPSRPEPLVDKGLAERRDEVIALLGKGFDRTVFGFVRKLLENQVSEGNPQEQ